jgi:hypothetical protein
LHVILEKRNSEPELGVNLNLSLIFEEEIMAVFSYDTAIKLPDLIKTGTEESRDFLNAVEAYSDILTADGKIALMRFVCRTKLKGEAKTKVGDVIVATFAELKNLINSKCGATKSIESLTKKLQIIKQGGKTAEEFAAEVQSLTNRIASIEITRTQAVTPETQRVVDSVFGQQGLTAFQNSIDPAIKPTVIASRPYFTDQFL